MLAYLAEELAARLKGDGEGQEIPVWEFFGCFFQNASIAPDMATRYTRHVEDVLSDAVPEEELAAICEELSPDNRELSERVLIDPHRYGSYECGPGSLPFAAAVPDED